MQKPKEPIKRAGARLVGMPPDDPVDMPVVSTPAVVVPTAVTVPKQKFINVLVPVEVRYCLTHAKERPCPVCEGMDSAFGKAIAGWLPGYALNKARGGREAILAKIKERLTGPIKPAEPADLKEMYADGNYDVQKYRHEIFTATRHTRKLLNDFPGWRGVQDLIQVIDYEVWLASKAYGDRMNGALAYTIAKNQSGKFIQTQMREQTIELKDENGEPVLDPLGNPVRVSRFRSFDDKGKDVDGDDAETSAAENKAGVEAAGFKPAGKNPGQYAHEESKAWQNAVIAKTRELDALIKTWHGAKRIVGEILLKKPDATVREFPGVPKSTAGRVRKVVLDEFRRILRDVGQEDD
jgi:hypothetical protein